MHREPLLRMAEIRDGSGAVRMCRAAQSDPGRGAGMMSFETAGLVAAALTTAAFLPQVIQTWRARSAAGLNLPMLVVFATGIALWLVYGLGTRQLPVILANGITLVLVSVLLGLKLRDRMRPPPAP